MTDTGFFMLVERLPNGNKSESVINKSKNIWKKKPKATNPTKPHHPRCPKTSAELQNTGLEN